MSKFEVTLKQLRAHGACVEGYNKVVSALKGIEYKERGTYIRFKHDEPIPLTFIVESNSVQDAIWCLQCNDKEWARDARLFAVWCARQVQHLMKDKRSLEALHVSEAFAKGLASRGELDIARNAAYLATRDARGVKYYIYYTAWATTRGTTWEAAYDAVCYVTYIAREGEGTIGHGAQKAMIIKMCNGEADWQVK